VGFPAEAVAGGGGVSGVRYYRIEYPEAIAAWDAYDSAVLALKTDCDAFAAKYPGARPVFSFSVHGQRFFGLRFTPVLNSPLWTIAQERTGFVQRPRSALPKSFKGDRKIAERERKALESDWASNIPEAVIGEGPSLDQLWKSLGTHWGDLLFGGIKRFRKGAAIYVATSVKLDPRAAEITGGEYLKAEGGAA
jgi:hypothetical protein